MEKLLYEDFHVYILDDSIAEEFQKKINGFAQQYSEKVTIIRRRQKTGFKAGNINYGLRQVFQEYKYFSISDADTILPRTFIAKLLPYFNNKKIAFVQSRQRFNRKQDSSFAKSLGYQIDLHYDHYLRTKNKYGFVMFYGHGALIRTNVWEQAGGIPEIATEDLAFSIKIRELGYYGIYAEDVVCLEEYPATYRQYRRRNEKWIRGTAECLLKFYPQFAANKNIKWFEKVDVLMSAFSLLLALPFFILLMLVGIILPFYYSYFRL